MNPLSLHFFFQIYLFNIDLRVERGGIFIQRSGF